ncbi:hypothetical protein [Coleofasciculus sp.]|uniref:hypothetical protein n=1 Tax=Coleofasciculus sp. TaxID=3100458 RepID=UPI0039F90358
MGRAEGVGEAGEAGGAGGAGEAGEEKINLELIRAVLEKMGCTHGLGKRSPGRKAYIGVKLR